MGPLSNRRSRRTPTSDGPACSRRCDLLAAAHRVPVAAVAEGISATQHGPSSFQRVARPGCVDSAAVGSAPPRAGYRRSRRVPDRRHHGRAIGQDDGVRGFDGHKRVKGCKSHILVDTLGPPIASRIAASRQSHGPDLDRPTQLRLVGTISSAQQGL